MKNLIGMTVVAFAFLLVAAAEPAQAQYGILGYGGIGSYGMYGLNGPAYSSGRIPTPPYFALHPPVYYSQPVARTYGHSPFAYPGTHATPNVVMQAAAKEIKNPHVNPVNKENKPKLDLRNLTKAGLEIQNPYVKTATKMVSYE